jgi:hypothetical protein
MIIKMIDMIISTVITQTILFIAVQLCTYLFTCFLISPKANCEVRAKEGIKSNTYAQTEDKATNNNINNRSLLRSRAVSFVI